MKLFRKTLCVLLAALLLGCTSLTAFAAGANVSVSLRIEGTTECLYYDTVSVPSGTCAMDVLKAADTASDAITLSITDSQYGGEYLAGINDTFAGSVAPMYYDGWQFLVNGIVPQDESTGYGHTLSSYIVADNDVIVVYYSDEFGTTGFMIPKINTADIADGKLSFTATVTSYDENWNPVTSEEAVKGYTLYWDGETITPDENGVATIPQDKLTAGDHTVQIERYAENGLPTVLRYASDYTVNVPEKSETGIAEFFAKIIQFLKTLIQTVSNFFHQLFSK